MHNRITARVALLAVAIAVAGTAQTAPGALGGISREGDYALEVYAKAGEVTRKNGIWTVGVPKEMGPLFTTAGVKAGSPVWMGDSPTTWQVSKVDSGWLSLKLSVRIPVTGILPEPIVHFRMAPWAELGNQMREDLKKATEENADYPAGVEQVLDRMLVLFGGSGMVEGFPGTAYEQEFRKTERVLNALIRAQAARGVPASATAKAKYRQVFGTDWPTLAVGRFWAADDTPVEVGEARSADGKTIDGTFAPKASRVLTGKNNLTGLFPCGVPLQLEYGAVDGGPEAKRHFPKVFKDDGVPTWFILQGLGAGQEIQLIEQRIENQGSVAVKGIVVLGGQTVAAPIPAGGQVDLCLAVSAGIVPQFRAELDESIDPQAVDYRVSAPVQNGDGGVVVSTERREIPEIILNNPEIMAVDVEVMSKTASGGFTRESKTRLTAGEMGHGVSVPAHKELELRCHFKSEFHRDIQVQVGALNYGGRSNLVLRAELKGDPVVTVVNAGTVAVTVSGGSGDTPTARILPGKNGTVTVAPGKKTTLSVVPENPEFEAPSVSVGSLEPEGKFRASVRPVLKPAPKVVLDNERGLMDAEATLVSATGRTLGRAVTIRRGKRSDPISIPVGSGMSFRLKYRQDGFEGTGTLAVPDLPRGAVKTLVVPSPKSLGSPSADRPAAPARPVSTVEPAVPLAPSVRPR